MSPVDVSTLDDDLAAIRERRGIDAIGRGDEEAPVDRIPLPSPSLMRITSGGIPLGRITRLWGDPSTGKTHVAYIIIAAAQALRSESFPNGLEAAYWNVEKIWDAKHAANLGVDTKRMLLEQVTIIEDIAREMETLLKSCHVHVIDSASAAVCVDELANEAEDWTRAMDARAWKRAIKRIHNSLDKDENALVIIDHSSRDQTTKQEFALGGKSLEFRSSMSLHFRKGSWLYYHPKGGYLETDEKIAVEVGTGPAGQKEADGIEVVVRVNKSRVCRPFRVARMRLDLNTFKFDTLFELLDAATFFDEDGGVAIRTGRPPIAEKTGAKSSWYRILGDDKDKVQGMSGLRERIDAEPALAAVILNAMLAGN
jgi:RecA/RadA recombinase